MKTYYLISFVGGLGMRWFSTGTLLSGHATQNRHYATHFDSIDAGLRVLAKRPNPYSSVQIHKITETPGTEVRTILGETEEAPKGAVVKYALQNFGAFLTIPAADQANFLTGILEGAALFSTHGEALTALQHAILANNGVGVYANTRLLRVAITASAPTITETVLS